MFFTGPIWLSILIPILFAPVLLIVSLLVRPRRTPGFDKSLFLSSTGAALAFLTGGAPFTAVLVRFVVFTHWIAFAIERRCGWAAEVDGCDDDLARALDDKGNACI